MCMVESLITGIALAIKIVVVTSAGVNAVYPAYTAGKRAHGVYRWCVEQVGPRPVKVPQLWVWLDKSEADGE